MRTWRVSVVQKTLNISRHFLLWPAARDVAQGEMFRRQQCRCVCNGRQSIVVVGSWKGGALRAPVLRRHWGSKVQQVVSELCHRLRARLM